MVSYCAFILDAIRPEVACRELLSQHYSRTSKYHLAHTQNCSRAVIEWESDVHNILFLNSSSVLDKQSPSQKPAMQQNNVFSCTIKGPPSGRGVLAVSRVSLWDKEFGEN